MNREDELPTAEVADLLELLGRMETAIQSARDYLSSGRVSVMLNEVRQLRGNALDASDAAIVVYTKVKGLG